MKWLERAKAQYRIMDSDWFNEQDELFNARVNSFQTQCLTEQEAQRLALKLYLRDYDLLKENHCFECQNLKGAPIFVCVKGKAVITNLEELQSCIGFMPLPYRKLR